MHSIFMLCSVFLYIVCTNTVIKHSTEDLFLSSHEMALPCRFAEQDVWAEHGDRGAFLGFNLNLGTRALNNLIFLYKLLGTL